MNDDPRSGPDPDVDDLTCEVVDGAFWERVQEGHEFPLGVLFCVTERCALKCPHCYQVRDGGGGGGPELTLTEIETLLDELASLGVFKFTITGGEPCLRPDLLGIAAAAWKRRFLIGLKTSGAFLTPAMVERLRANGLSTMVVSVYHDNPEKHDAFVGHDGAFHSTMDSISLFRQSGGVVVVNTVAMSWNLDAIAPLTSICKERDWSLTVDPKVVHANDGNDRALRFQSNDAQLLELLGRDASHIVRGASKSPDDLVCLAGVNTVYIKPNGEVWPCPVMPLSMGNIRESSLADIWANSPVRRRVLAMRWGDSEKCRTCEINRFCQRCPGEALQEHGSLARESSMDCAMAEAYARIWAESHPDD